MDLELISEVATIIGSISIFLTLFFIIIELKKNVDQTKSVNMANRDDTATNFVLFWSQDGNAELVLKGQKNYDLLNEIEKFRFEGYVETRIRLFMFGATTVNSKNLPFHYYRMQDFFKPDGTMKCYENLMTRKMIPPMWKSVIDTAFSTP